MARRQPPQAPRKPSGPPPERLTVEGDWKAAVKRALKRGKPPKSDKK
jgi:hypothetical protein